MREETRSQTERREREASRDFANLRRQQTGLGLTIALATADGDEVTNCVTGQSAVSVQTVNLAIVLPKHNIRAA
jgi:hypothetical protein